MPAKARTRGGTAPAMEPMIGTKATNPEKTPSRSAPGIPIRYRATVESRPTTAIEKRRPPSQPRRLSRDFDKISRVLSLLKGGKSLTTHSTTGPGRAVRYSGTNSTTSRPVKNEAIPPKRPTRPPSTRRTAFASV